MNRYFEAPKSVAEKSNKPTYFVDSLTSSDDKPAQEFRKPIDAKTLFDDALKIYSDKRAKVVKRRYAIK